MNVKLYVVLVLSTCLEACGQVSTRDNSSLSDTVAVDQHTRQTGKKGIINPDGNTIHTRIQLPTGYQRINVPGKSFANFLRQLPLKPHNAEVHLYNGYVKENYNVYDGVVDLAIGNKDLHQCADAVMRLRAEYLWDQGQYNKIHFNFTNGFRVDYTEWMKGRRIVVKGNSAHWEQTKTPSNTYKDFWAYMETIFTYAGTLSLSKELNPVDVKQMQIGDVFIQGGTPGHAIMVVDMAENIQTGEKIFLLAQSYMPAQEIQILRNRGDATMSPWYNADFEQELVTPEWTFERDDLKRFSDE